MSSASSASNPAAKRLKVDASATAAAVNTAVTTVTPETANHQGWTTTGMLRTVEMELMKHEDFASGSIQTREESLRLLKQEIEKEHTAVQQDAGHAPKTVDDTLRDMFHIVNPIVQQDNWVKAFVDVALGVYRDIVERPLKATITRLQSEFEKKLIDKVKGIVRREVRSETEKLEENLKEDLKSEINGLELGPLVLDRDANFQLQLMKHVVEVWLQNDTCVNSNRTGKSFRALNLLMDYAVGKSESDGHTPLEFQLPLKYRQKLNQAQQNNGNKGGWNNNWSNNSWGNNSWKKGGKGNKKEPEADTIDHDEF